MDETLRGYWNHCGLNLLFLSQLWEESLEDKLYVYGITLRELMLLRLIASNAFIRKKDLVVYVGRHHESVNKILASLEKKQLIIRDKKRECGSKSSSLADITESGYSLLLKTELVLRKQDEIFMGHLPRATRMGVNATLENMLEKTLAH